MVLTIAVLLMILVIVFFGLASFSVAAPPRLNWLALGLFTWAIKVAFFNGT